MPKEHVLIELPSSYPAAFQAFSAALQSESESIDQAEAMLDPLAGLDIDVDGSLPPVPMFSAVGAVPTEAFALLAEFAST